MQAIYENDDIRLMYISELQCLIEHWNGYVHDDNYRETNLAVLELRHKFPIKRLVSVTYNKFHVTPEWIKWSHEVVLHELVENGLKHFAFVMSNHQLARFAIAQFVDDNREDINLRVFHFYPEALAWVSEQP